MTTEPPPWLPDCGDRTVLVTGANSGIGYETARAFATAGATVLMACRSTDRGESAADELRADDPDGSLAVLECDLAALSSVERCAAGVRERVEGIDVLVNNAGVMAIPRRETADGFEMQLGVNHLGHFALTGRLLPALRATGGVSRVVTVSSGAHRMGELQFDDLDGEGSYGKWSAYAASKLANLLFAFELQRRIEAAECAGLASLAAHPGYAATNLQFRGPEMEGSRLKAVGMRLANWLFGQSARGGALPLLYAATSPEVAGGDFVGPGGVLQLRGDPEVVEPADRARDRETARRLWEVSVERTGVSYDLAAPSATE